LLVVHLNPLIRLNSDALKPVIARLEALENKPPKANGDAKLIAYCYNVANQCCFMYFCNLDYAVGTYK